MKKFALFFLFAIIYNTILYAAPEAVTDLAVVNAGFGHVILSWSTPYDNASSTTAAYYEIRLSTNNEINSETKWDNNSSVTTYPYRVVFTTAEVVSGERVLTTVSGLVNGGNNYFAIKSSTDNINWSVIITTYVSPNGIPVNTNPNLTTSYNVNGNATDGFIVDSSTPTLFWNAPNAGVGPDGTNDSDYGDTISDYYIDISEDSNFSIKYTTEGITAASWITYTLSENTTYWWRVKARDSGGAYYTGSMIERRFIVNAVNGAPSDFSLTSPINSFMWETSKRPNFTWQPSIDSDPGDTLTYTVFYSTDINFDVNVTTQIPNRTSSPYTPTSDLIENATYYWKVYAVDSLGKYTVSSSTGIVIINDDNDAPTMPTLLEPINNVVIRISTPTLVWQQSVEPDPGDYVTYTIRYSSSDPTLNLEYSSIGSLQTTNYILSSLAEDVTYWWRIVYEDHGAPINSNWTSISSFTVNAVSTSTYSFSLFASSGIISNLKPLFDWSDATDPDGDDFTYTFFCSSYSSFSSYISSAGLVTSSFTPIDDLEENRIYYWKVQTIDIYSAVRNSDIWTIGIDVNPENPADFILTSPSNGSQITDFQPQFDWSDASDPDPFDIVSNYKLYYTTSSDLSAAQEVDVTVSSYTFLVNSAYNNKTFYWWVKAIADLSGETTTQIRSFNVLNNPPRTFNLASSSGIVNTLAPLLDWEDSSDPEGDSFTYTLYYSLDSGFNTYESSKGIISSQLQLPVLTENSTYYWYVEAIDSWDNTRQSNQTWSINVNADDEYPNPFDLVSPADSSKLDTLRPQFDWEDTIDPDINNAISYVLWYSTDSSFTFRNEVSVTGASDYTLQKSLSFSAKYYWKVFAVSSDGQQTESSSTWMFTVMDEIRPKAPANFEAAVSSNAMVVTLTWNAVTQNTDNSTLTNLAGYKVYKSFSINNIFTVSVATTVSLTTLSWVDEKDKSQTVYYMIKAYNDWDIDGLPSSIKEVGEEGLDLIYPEDQSLTISYRAGSISQAISIEVTRISDDEDEIILGSYMVTARDASNQEIDMTFGEPLTLTFRLSTFSAALKKEAPAFGSSYVGVFWHNGVEWVYIGGQENDGNVVVRSPYLGAYQLRVVSGASEFRVLKTWPRIITPNNDGRNDAFNVTFENTTSNETKGCIYDLNGACVAKMDSVTDAWLTWSGKFDNGEDAPVGIYLYQVKCGAKTYNGTMVVAR
ncbi:MAG: gliding motility-associated C-terminal domain-containing protein [Endomicrobiales bacterium]|nr:gliding motility-associated C-terminal domain-containing protein [Endomicrobiales bacterium]